MDAREIYNSDLQIISKNYDPVGEFERKHDKKLQEILPEYGEKKQKDKQRVKKRADNRRDIRSYFRNYK